MSIRIGTSSQYPVQKRRPIAATSLLIILACSTLARGGIDFYSYYEKAEDARRKGDCSVALRYYRQALELRSEPGANIRTYGLNTIDYYPYTGAAVCAFELGELDTCDEMIRTAQKYAVEPAEALTAVESKLKAARDLLAASRAAPTVLPPQNGPGASQTGPASGPPTTARSQESPPRDVPAPRGSIDVTSEPSGADVVLNGRPQGRTPLRLTRTPGKYRVIVRLPGHEPDEQEAVIEPGRTTYHHVNLRTEVPEIEAEPHVMTSEERAVAQTQAIAEEPRSSEPETGGQGAVGGANGGVPMHIWLAAAGALLVAGLFVFWILPSMRGHGEGRGVVAQTTASDSPTFNIAGSPPHTFGDYRIVKTLGHGGMSYVYLAHDARANPVALKVLHRHLFETPTVRERFLREAELGQTLHHPNIVTVQGGGVVSDTPFIVMEYVEGETLKDVLVRRRKLPAGEAIKLTIKVAEALDYAHLKGVIHRDLKPANILLTKSGTVKVMDYGIARAVSKEGLTATGAFMGTPAYMAPETSEAKPVDQRSDMYSLGVVLFETLTGRIPFESESPFQMIEMHRINPPPTLRSFDNSIPEVLEPIVARLLEKDPGRRFESAEVVINELRAAEKAIEA